MNRAGRAIAALISAAAPVAGATLAFPCGFEDPNGADRARGTLNWAYPDALHVTSAVWRAQLEGVLSRDDRPAAVKALVGFRRITADLSALRERLAPDRGEPDLPAFSMVLIGPMLWNRFASVGKALTISVHASGPEDEDVVIVTDQPVLAALIEGRITPQAAQERGLIRFYGPADRVSAIMARVQQRLGVSMAAERLDDGG